MNANVDRGGTMTQERTQAFKFSRDVNHMIAEANQEDRAQRTDYVHRARQLGETLDATLVAITGFPPGIDANPAVYRGDQDESYFMVAGKKGEVARYDDPEEIRKKAKRVYRVPVKYVEDYVIVPFDFERRIEEGGLFYTPEGYIEHKRYDPKSDPPLVNQGSTPPSSTK